MGTGPLVRPDDEPQLDGTTDEESGIEDRPVRSRPPGVSDELVAAIGKASEAFECLERARGHLYSFHQLMGHADLTFGEAVDLLREAGADADADELEVDVVGRNVLDGRWSFQIVEEFDDVYYSGVRAQIERLEAEHLDGVRHLYESEMKERRRTRGRRGHAARPARSEPPEDPGPPPAG